MKPVMGVKEVREFEERLVAEGTSSAELMRRAGAVVALQAAHLVHGGAVVVLCGTGNNGGDGWVAADNLARHGYEVCVVSAVAPDSLRGVTARRMAARAVEMGVPVYVDPSRDQLSALLHGADVVVDALFGIGFHGVLPAPYDAWVDVVNAEFGGGSLVSVDVPSGVDAETGMAEGPFFTADVTVTMFALKPGLVSGVGRDACGQVAVATLVDGDDAATAVCDGALAFMASDEEFASILPVESPLQDKFSHGRVLVVAGSGRFPGAAVLCAMAAARSGVGYVTLAVPAPVVPVAQARLLSVPVVGLPAAPNGSFAPEAAESAAALAQHADAVVVGPGLTVGTGPRSVVLALLGTQAPLVLDADALNIVAEACQGSLENVPGLLRREAPLVLTPHHRELARLTGLQPADTRPFSGSLRAAQRLVWAVGSSDFCVVAKGPLSGVVGTEGALVPEPGPAALATAGTGDVLAGAVAGYLAQGIAVNASCGLVGLEGSPLISVVAAADRIHAIAGDLACEAHGSRGVVATDVAEQLGLAFDVMAGCAARPQAYDAGGELDSEMAFEDESRVAPAPEVERMERVAADARAIEEGREAYAPGQTLFSDDLAEPEEPVGPAAPEGEPAPGPGEEPVQRPAAPVAQLQGDDAEKTEVEAAGEVAPDAMPQAEVELEVKGEAQREPEPDPVPAAEPGPCAQGGGAGREPAAPVCAPAPAHVPWTSRIIADDALELLREVDLDLDEPARGADAAAAADEAVVPAAQARAAGPGPSTSALFPRVAAQRPAEEAGTALPPFLMRAVAASSLNGSAAQTAVMEPVGRQDGADPEDDWPLAAALDSDPEPDPEPVSPEEERRRLRSGFHRLATTQVGSDDVTPLDERPSVRRHKNP